METDRNGGGVGLDVTQSRTPPSTPPPPEGDMNIHHWEGSDIATLVPTGAFPYNR